MASYHYKAMTESMSNVTSVMEAGSRNEVISRLRTMGLKPMKIWKIHSKLLKMPRPQK